MSRALDASTLQDRYCELVDILARGVQRVLAAQSSSGLRSDRELSAGIPATCLEHVAETVLSVHPG